MQIHFLQTEHVHILGQLHRNIRFKLYNYEESVAI